MATRMEPEARRAWILDVALARIDDRGHLDLTMTELARRCGMTRQGVLHYFPSIPALLVALVERRDQRDIEELELEFAGPWVPSMRTARAALDRVVANIVARPRSAQLYAALSADALDPTHPGHEYFRERSRAIASWLAALLGGEHERERAARLLATIDGLQLQFLRDPERFDLTQQWAVAADALLPER